MNSKLCAIWLIVGLSPISTAIAQSNFESSKLSSGAVVQGIAVQSPKLSPGAVVQNAGLQSSKLSVGVVVQVLPVSGIITRAPLVHW